MNPSRKLSTETGQVHQAIRVILSSLSADGEIHLGEGEATPPAPPRLMLDADDVVSGVDRFLNLDPKTLPRSRSKFGVLRPPPRGRRRHGKGVERLLGPIRSPRVSATSGERGCANTQRG